MNLGKAMGETDREELSYGTKNRSHRRDTMRSIGMTGLAMLAGVEFAATRATEAAGKKRGKRRKRRRGGGGHGVGDPLAFQKVEGTPFTVEDGESNDGFADCPNSGTAISGGMTQTNTKCFLAQSNRADDELWGFTVTCPTGAGSTTVTPFAICLSG
jgi:hypothetical protein